MIQRILSAISRARMIARWGQKLSRVNPAYRTLIGIAVVVGIGVLLYWKWKSWLFVGIYAGVVLFVMLLLYLLSRGERMQADRRAAGFDGALEEFGETWNGAIEELDRRGIDRHELGFYMLIGEPQSGKSTTLHKSGLNFPLGVAEMEGSGGTQNCNWWFAEQAIILDTAGRLTFHADNTSDEEEWKFFLDNLRKYKPAAPINGVLITIPCTSLLHDPSEEHERKATIIRCALDQLQNTLEIRFPAYVLLTKADQIAGFTDFFAHMKATEQKQLFGWSRPKDRLDAPFKVAELEEAFDDICAGLRRQRLSIVHAHRMENNPQAVDRLYAFPEEFAGLRKPLQQYLETIFPEVTVFDRPFVRGFYVTSGMQTGGAVMREVAHILGVEGTSPEFDEVLTPQDHRAFFIRDFYRKKVFKEPGLIRATKGRLKRARGVRIWGYGLSSVAAVAVLVFLGFYFRRVTGTVTEPLRVLQETYQAFVVDAKADKDHAMRAAKAMEVLPRIAQFPREVVVESPPGAGEEFDLSMVQGFLPELAGLPTGFGLNSGTQDELTRNLQRIYRVLMVEGPVAAAQQRVLDQLEFDDLDRFLRDLCRTHDASDPSVHQHAMAGLIGDVAAVSGEDSSRVNRAHDVLSRLVDDLPTCDVDEEPWRRWRGLEYDRPFRIAGTGAAGVAPYARVVERIDVLLEQKNQEWLSQLDRPSDSADLSSLAQWYHLRATLNAVEGARSALADVEKSMLDRASSISSAVDWDREASRWVTACDDVLDKIDGFRNLLSKGGFVRWKDVVADTESKILEPHYQEFLAITHRPPHVAIYEALLSKRDELTTEWHSRASELGEWQGKAYLDLIAFAKGVPQEAEDLKRWEKQLHERARWLYLSRNSTGRLLGWQGGIKTDLGIEPGEFLDYPLGQWVNPLDTRPHDAAEWRRRSTDWISALQGVERWLFQSQLAAPIDRLFRDVAWGQILQSLESDLSSGRSMLSSAVPSEPFGIHQLAMCAQAEYVAPILDYLSALPPRSASAQQQPVAYVSARADVERERNSIAEDLTGRCFAEWSRIQGDALAYFDGAVARRGELARRIIGLARSISEKHFERRESAALWGVELRGELEQFQTVQWPHGGVAGRELARLKALRGLPRTIDLEQKFVEFAGVVRRVDEGFEVSAFLASPDTQGLLLDGLEGLERVAANNDRVSSDAVTLCRRYVDSIRVEIVRAAQADYNQNVHRLARGIADRAGFPLSAHPSPDLSRSIVVDKDGLVAFRNVLKSYLEKYGGGLDFYPTPWDAMRRSPETSEFAFVHPPEVEAFLRYAWEVCAFSFGLDGATWADSVDADVLRVEFQSYAREDHLDASAKFLVLAPDGADYEDERAACAPVNPGLEVDPNGLEFATQNARKVTFTWKGQNESFRLVPSTRTPVTKDGINGLFISDGQAQEPEGRFLEYNYGYMSYLVFLMSNLYEAADRGERTPSVVYSTEEGARDCFVRIRISGRDQERPGGRVFGLSFRFHNHLFPKQYAPVVPWN